MIVLARAITYAALFIGFVLVFLPARVLSWSGITALPPVGLGASQVVGMGVGAGGIALALWCVGAFAIFGKGTPAPFDPPRQLVIRGPYWFVRNPMYIGATFTLAGAALYYESLTLLGYTIVFFAITHGFVLLYEEPTLRRLFGDSYLAYCREVSRWWPRQRPKGGT